MSNEDGTINWRELLTTDVEAAKAYFESICGWEYDSMRMPGGEDYVMARVGGKPVAGIMSRSDFPGGDKMPPFWLSYLVVKDVDDAVAETKAAGGSIIRDCFDIPGMGRIAIVTDPTGAFIGLMTPAEMSQAA